ncbi:MULTISPECIES: MFS transporter [Streptacidiphilus]|uniref:MFS transporter n=1 Tax=Streptacidiphilus cavernicola TaxID=3342716 RepID=A0ABV6UML2_9ACTN|nr:MFS transporter [Streptacidiphilus jeojiense]
MSAPAAPAAAPSGPVRTVPDGLVVALACLGQFMVVLDVSIVNVALPAIRGSLGFSAADLPWVVNAYALAFAGFMLLGGRAADLYGRRRTFVAGVTVFTLASLLGGLAPSAGVLVAARAVQGLGGAVLAPCTLTILTTAFAEGARRTRAIATWSMVGAVGGAAGAILGGLLTDYLSWRWILLVNLPVGVFVVIGSRLWLADDRGSGGGRRLDVPGAAAVSLGLTAVVYGIVQAGKDGWGRTGTLLPLVAGVLLLGLFVLIEARIAGQPLLPLRLLRSWQLSGANVVMFLLGAGFFSVLYFVSLYLQNVRHYSPVEAGLVFVPHAVATVVGAKSAARLLAAGRRAPLLILTGLLVSAVGFLWQAQLGTHTNLVTGVILPGTVIFLGIGLALTPVAMTATSGVPGADAGIASGLANASRQIGGSFGLVALTGIAAAYTRDLLAARDGGGGATAADSALVSGYDRAFYCAAGILALCVLVTLTLPRPRPAAVPAQASEVTEAEEEPEAEDQAGAPTSSAASEAG